MITVKSDPILLHPTINVWTLFNMIKNVHKNVLLVKMKVGPVKGLCELGDRTWPQNFWAPMSLMHNPPFLLLPTDFFSWA
jgi:hypothetical protein